MVFKYIIAAAIGYLLGSVSFAVIITKGFLNKDVRTMGSGNAGATNVARVFGFGVGIATLAGDMLKTVISMYIGQRLGGDIGVAIAGASCMIGHNWPIYYKFKGGKGVAVGAAMAMYLSLKVIAILVVIFLLVAFTTRFVSLASITVAVAFPIILLIAGERSVPLLIMAVFASVLVILRHMPNIKRLLAGTEPKFKAKSANNVSKDDYGGEK